MEELLGLLGKCAEKEEAPLCQSGVRLCEEALSAMGAKLPEMGAKLPEMGAKLPEMGAKLPEMGGSPAEAGTSPDAAKFTEKAPLTFEPVRPVQLIDFNKFARVGGGDEGIVYSNGDGTVTKVFHDMNADVDRTAVIFDRLRSLGINVPDTIAAGKTAQGNPALIMQQLGEGDHLQTQLMLGEVSPAEFPALSNQYQIMAKTLQDNGLRVDWQLKNMTWHNGKLYLLDPSYLKEEPLSQWVVDRMRPHV